MQVVAMSQEATAANVMKVSRAMVSTVSVSKILHMAILSVKYGFVERV